MIAIILKFLKGDTFAFILLAGIFLVIFVMPVCMHVKKHRKDKALTEHNNLKYQKQIETEQADLKNKQKQEHDYNLKPAELKLYKQLLVDKSCVEKHKDLPSNKIAAICKKNLPVLTPEQVKEQTEKQLRELGGF